jgi:glycolate oxidase FAD binding subunit
MPMSLMEPLDGKQAAAILADADRQGLSIVPRGSGTKLAWSTASSAGGTYLSTKRLNTPIQHYAGDLVATLPSGATLSAANATLAQSGQWLPLDPSFADCATIGGIVATNDSGPRRYKYGSPRDLIIGVEIALCDGRIAKAGGRVVKNVAGYDLSRLMCGSFGTLAVITSATFKLAPLPPASRTIVASCADLDEAARLALSIASQPVTPSALEIEAPTPRLLIRFETTERAADRMSAATRTLLDEHGVSADVIADSAEREIWKAHESSIWDHPGLVVKISVLPTDVESCLRLTSGSLSSSDWCAIGRAALGVLLVRLSDDERGRDVVARLRQHVVDKGGSLVVLRGDAAELRRPQSQSATALRAVMDAVKARFDPHGVLPRLPGRIESP